MRFVVYGAGAIGGVIGARLAQGGHQVVLIARGQHLEAIRQGGLRLDSPAGTDLLEISAVAHPGEIGFRNDDVVLLTVKSQHTVAALGALREVAPHVAVACVQNGVDNERQAQRLFPEVYGVCVMCPATHLQPGIVQANAWPTTGILDIGRYPHGEDHLAGLIAAALGDSTFSSEVQPHIMRWKYAKLLNNLGNAIEAVIGPPARGGAIMERARSEGIACLEAAGIDFASEEEDAARRSDLIRRSPVRGEGRQGGSSWQSLRRAAGSIETDYLNGEIVRLGRTHGVPTPVNALLQTLANRLARRGQAPGSLPEPDFFRLLGERA